ncbi:hypothetical protein L3Q82_003451 [Scortum barcoo]|uniref:Uncharacterized protein n=1 Tax=Scortum barcoo TaxID=214431 RepID=A0ACB8VMR6_9TELE|nr:hypothetical protein L3Q82_003451 [Scortum barcoo]
MDEMKLRIVSAKIDSCVVIVTETWLDNNIPDAAVELVGHSVLRARQDCNLGETQRRRTRPTTRTVQVWTEEASSTLQDCFECTDWEVFKEGTDLDGYTSSVLSYLKFCNDAVLPTKTIKVFQNKKPLLDSTVKPLLKACDTTCKSALTHLQLPNTYVRMLFVDFSSAFNTVIPDKLILKLHNLGLPSSLCHWIRDFLTNKASGCDCSVIHSTNTIVKFADDTTIVGLISDNDETHYKRGDPAPYSVVFKQQPFLNTSKTKEVIVDYRRSRRSRSTLPLLIHGEAVERVNNIKFLGIHITSDLTWSMNTAHLVKKAQQRLFFLRKLKRAGLSPQLLTNFYRSHNREHPLPQCSSVVWQLHCTRPKGLSPGGENGTGDCGKSSSRPGLNTCWPDSEKGPTYCCRPYPPGQWTVCTASSGKRQTECGKGKCPYDPFQKTASTVVDGELYAGITSDFMSRDSAFFRSLGNRHIVRTEQYDSTWLHDAQFVRVVPLSETDNPEDDKVYVFFTERAQEAEGATGKVLYSRVARVCKNDIGGQRSLVNKWSTFQKARMVCSVPGHDGLQTHFDQLQDIFILHSKDKNNPLIYGLFTTSSDILNGSAVCVYRMQDMVRAFKGNFLHKEGSQYKWAEFTGKVPYPRPGTCPSSTYGSYSSTREYPDDVIFFSRTHPLLQENVQPLRERPLLVRVGVQYKFSKLIVDRVEAVDGTYDVLFIGTDSGLVLKAIHLPREHIQSQEITLEQLQVFKHKSPVTAMTLSEKKHWLFVGSREGVSQLAMYQCELYGQACAECCLARDPYCTWDGHACSPFMSTVRRRNTRHLGEDEDPLTQCVKQGARLHVEAEQRVMMVAEGNSTYLECLPRSRHADVTWYKQAGKNSPELNQVITGDQLLVIERGILIREAELSHSGIYHCQVEEHGYYWTAVTVRLAVWSPTRLLMSSSSLSYHSAGSQPWYEDVMALIDPRNLGQHCRVLGYRPPRNHRRHSHIVVEPKKEKETGKRHNQMGGRGEARGRAPGRKSRSKPKHRAPRSA